GSGGEILLGDRVITSRLRRRIAVRLGGRRLGNGIASLGRLDIGRRDLRLRSGGLRAGGHRRLIVLLIVGSGPRRAGGRIGSGSAGFKRDGGSGLRSRSRGVDCQIAAGVGRNNRGLDDGLRG